MTKSKFTSKYILITILVLFSVKSYSQNWDINTLKNINPQNPNSGFMRGLSSSSYPVGFIVPATQLIAGYANKNKLLQRQGWETVGSLAITVVVTEGLKYAVNRQRPYEKYPGIIYPYDAMDKGQSLPSAHTSIAFATATSLTLEYKKWYVAVPAYLWAAGVGYSHMYLGEHYPTDVIAGAAVGAGSAWVSHWLTKKVFNH